MADATPQDAKSILESKTFWGMVVGLAIPLAAKHGWIVDPNGAATDISSLVGAVLALYGRVTASKPVKLV